MRSFFNVIFECNRPKLLGLMILLAGMTGCSLLTPAPKVHQPMTMQPAPVPNITAKEANGSIYHIAYSHPTQRYIPLFEDRRARGIGDTIIVVLNERTNASKRSASNIGRESQTSFSIPSFLGLPLKKIFQGVDLETESENKFDGKGASSSNNNFTGTITVTVIDVLPNGNLLVSGEKQVGINQGHEFIRLSGVINPINILNNTVSSIQVADARIEYRGNGYLDEAQTMGWLSRFFLTVLPF